MRIPAGSVDVHVKAFLAARKSDRHHKPLESSFADGGRRDWVRPFHDGSAFRLERPVPVNAICARMWYIRKTANEPEVVPVTVTQCIRLAHLGLVRLDHSRAVRVHPIPDRFQPLFGRLLLVDTHLEVRNQRLAAEWKILAAARARSGGGPKPRGRTTTRAASDTATRQPRSEQAQNDRRRRATPVGLLCAAIYERELNAVSQAVQGDSVVVRAGSE